MEEEIIAAGIHQALKRGEPLNRAIQSFINAGYSREAVDKAVKLVNSSQDLSLYTPLIPAARPGMKLQPDLPPGFACGSREDPRLRANEAGSRRFALPAAPRPR